MKPDVQVLADYQPWAVIPKNYVAKIAAIAFDAVKKHPFKNRHVEISVVLTSDKKIQKLNATYRGKNTPTNVLSFELAVDLPESKAPIMLGDVVLAYQTIKREAKEQKKPFKAHLTHLIIHGVLHLLGYDHIKKGDAQRMERLEKKILKDLGLPDPYKER